MCDCVYLYVYVCRTTRYTLIKQSVITTWILYNFKFTVYKLWMHTMLIILFGKCCKDRQINCMPLSSIYTASMDVFTHSTEICQVRILPIALFEQIAKYSTSYTACVMINVCMYESTSTVSQYIKLLYIREAFKHTTIGMTIRFTGDLLHMHVSVIMVTSQD